MRSTAAARASIAGRFTLLQTGSVGTVRGLVFGLVGTVNGVITFTDNSAAGSPAEGAGMRTVVVLSGCLHRPLLPALTHIRAVPGSPARRPV